VRVSESPRTGKSTLASALHFFILSCWLIGMAAPPFKHCDTVSLAAGALSVASAADEKKMKRKAILRGSCATSVKNVPWLVGR